MNILSTDTATSNDRVLLYKLTRSPEVQKLSTIAGQRIDVSHFALYEDEKPDKSGEIRKSTIIAFMTREGELFASNSATVRDEWGNILQIFGADLEQEGGYIPVRIIEGISKNDRKFLTLTYGA